MKVTRRMRRTGKQAVTANLGQLINHQNLISNGKRAIITHNLFRVS